MTSCFFWQASVETIKTSVTLRWPVKKAWRLCYSKLQTKNNLNLNRLFKMNYVKAIIFNFFINRKLFWHIIGSQIENFVRIMSLKIFNQKPCWWRQQWARDLTNSMTSQIISLSIVSQLCVCFSSFDEIFAKDCLRLICSPHNFTKCQFINYNFQ